MNDVDTFSQNNDLSGQTDKIVQEGITERVFINE